ncbi:hypothetical protein ATG98_1258 [Marinobacter sp. LV10R520-4]|uniref:hypothetical protein n=3 Tax=unclassified Marinobacter TaxID=83889 RepID=UPI000BFA90DE|nr:hypothetical protein [Marinobacter sp. LV10R520-4]PFG52250.1 hypothetical protein ATG98_1258 [Marinobacter sp. LV10R520-4]
MKRSVFGLALFLSLPVAAQDFDLTDMAPARPGGTVDTAGVSSEGDMVLAESDQQGVAVAHQQLMDSNSDGIKLIQVGSGIGILSTGSTSYQTYDNLNATLLSKRGAYTQAALIAKKQLIENITGLQQTCENAAQSTIDVIDTGSDSVGNTQTSLRENCAETVKGALSGYVTFDVYDNTDDKEVRVSLISTPKTRAQIRSNRGAVSVTSDPNAIFKEVVADINRGVLPPVGAKVLTHADSGEVVLMGYGSAIIRNNSNKQIARKLKDAAKRQSQTRARSALLATMQGEEVYWEGGFNEKQIEGSQQFEYVDPSLQDPAEVKILDQERNSFLNQMKMSDVYGSVTKGQLPPGVSTRSFGSKDGYWMYTVAVYAPTLEATAREAGREMQGKAAAKPSDTGRNISIHNGLNENSANPSGASGQVSNSDSL